MEYILEACVDSAESALAAQRSGASIPFSLLGRETAAWKEKRLRRQIFIIFSLKRKEEERQNITTFLPIFL